MSFTIFKNEKTPFWAIKRRRSKSWKIDIFRKMAIFNIFFLVDTGKENVFYDILERKNAFRAYENRKFKSRKIDIFPKGISHGFGPKKGHFSSYFFLGTIGQENVFYDILEQKNTFVGYKNKKLKKSKNWHISKGDNSWFWSKKGPFFQLLFLGTIGQENVFYDILEQKNIFVGYKNKKLKKSKNWHISKGDNSWFWSKNGHFSNDTIRIEYREERLVFCLQCHQTIFVGQICLKRKNKPSWNFWPKPWTNSFWKMQILRLF